MRMVKHKDSRMVMSHREWLRELAECDKVISDEEVEAFGQIPGEGNVDSEDEADEELEAERVRLNCILGLPADTYSLTKIKITLPETTTYGIRSGINHMNMKIFSPFSRGLQGGAISIAAFATTGLLKPRLWNESIIDQIIVDGDTYFCDSYRDIKTPNRRTLTILQLKESLTIQRTHKALVAIEDAAYTGTFRSLKPTEMHLVKALELFFRNYEAAVLISPVLNISIWRDERSFNIFDGQPRDKNLTPDDSGSAKLISLQDLNGVFFVILEKSDVKNEYFVLYPIRIKALMRLMDDDEKVLAMGPPQRRPSGYIIQGTYRALVRGSFHLNHPNIPQVLQGRTHLIIAIAALVYSRLISAAKWSTPMLDLIINQSHIYFVDLIRVLEKKLDGNFSLSIGDLLGDFFLGVYGAKVKVWQNVIPGQAKKGKTTIDSGLRDFFKANDMGILEVKRMFYAVWKDSGKFYFLDPFACDAEGFRVDSSDPEEQVRYQSATACVTMNSSINELMEMILENTGNTEKDPFFLHGVQVLYVKTYSSVDSPGGAVVFREKKTNRRPLPPAPAQEPSDHCVTKLDMIPRPRPDNEKIRSIESQYPDPMTNVEDFMKTDEELSSMADDNEHFININFYKIINPHRITLQATKNCLSDSFNESSRGRQGLSIALSVISLAKIKHPSKWRSPDLDYLIESGDKAHADLVNWIQKGSPKLKGESEDMDEDDEDDDDDDDDDDEEEDTEDADDEVEDEEDKEENLEDTKPLMRAPSHIDISMLPPRMKFGDNEVKFSRRMSLAEGDADPLVNLGEALDRYFLRYDELILENKRLMYPIWKINSNYFMFNSYGADDEGWRLRGHAGTLVITDTMNELIDLLHGVLEFNDRKFFLHFIHIESIGPGNKYKSPVTIEQPLGDVEKYQTVFLPLTDADVLALMPEPKETQVDDEGNEDTEGSDDDDDDDDDEDNDSDEKEPKDEISEEKEDYSKEEKMIEAIEEIPLIDPLIEIQEQDRPDAPKQLNLFLLTTNVKLEDEEVDQNTREALEYERLKYNHPPPYVLPPKRVLAMLLAAKKATKSIPSLVSCFSIDSKLAVKTDLPVDTANQPVIESPSTEHNSKLIKLPPKKYLFSRITPIGFTPLRAINEKFIHDERVDKEREKKCRDKKLKATTSERFYLSEVPEVPVGVRIMPSIIPLGPVIMTPIPKLKVKPCVGGDKRQCRLSAFERENLKLEKIVCYTEDILFDMIFPMLKFDEQTDGEESEAKEDSIDLQESPPEDPTPPQEENQNKTETPQEAPKLPETYGFQIINNSSSILRATSHLENPSTTKEYHLNTSYYSAILCILAKIKMDPNEFPTTLLDQIILLSNKIYMKTGSLRYKLSRIFRNIEFLGIKFNVILKQIAYADPENFDDDALSKRLETYLISHPTGILIFADSSYAFWFTNGNYYLFDPYSCDATGERTENGTACLLEYSSISDMIEKIQEKSRTPPNQPYRIHTLCITHLEEIKPKKKPRNTRKEPKDEENEESPLEIDEPDVPIPLRPNVSLIELKDWVHHQSKISEFDITYQTFRAINNFNASALEVPVVFNDITRPNLPPFKTSKVFKSLEDYPRRKPFDRKFNEHSILLEPIDLCTMAWACIRDPTEWGTRTIRGIYEASQDLAFDSLLAAEDSTVSGMIDSLLTEFDVANYRFHSVFAPIHIGKLYATEGWNLSMSLKKIFDTPIYSGAVVLCGKAHIGVMRRSNRYYAWWGVTNTKNIRFITSESFEDFLKLLIILINEPDDLEFQIRVVTVSYAKKMDPNCDDLKGLHEPGICSSLPQIYRKDREPYDLNEIFRPTVPSSSPLFISGTVAIDQRDLIKEPVLKRCYFVAVIALMVKRDIMQSPMTSMIDKILQVADNLYREFDNPKYHTEHILRNVTIMNRIFDFRDVASNLFTFTENHSTGQNDFYPLVKSELKKHFKKHNDGILHFTNCCYGFWYSRGTNCYYYLDPYPCNFRGKRVSINGSACLCVFPSICQMVKQICSNRLEDTTGFFIHRLHVESINAAPFSEFQEDAMWVYLDYHWSSHHASKTSPTPRKKKKRKKSDKQDKEDICKEETLEISEKTRWNNYTIEVPQLIYSLWGTLGSYDSHFGERGGKNQAAICVAVVAMQYLCHPSRWSPGILDSAVICGDSYYTKSLKNAARRGSKYSNIFNLQPCFKVFPHIWKIEYLPSMCGTLYGGKGRLPLSNVLKLALEESKNILLRCGKITIGLLSAEDGYYVADPCWTGPPLFLRQRGAIYVLRCNNFHTLVYSLVKMINSNQRLEFSLTPVIFEFKQEACRSSDEKKHVERRIVMESVGVRPGLAQGPRLPVCGATTVNDEDDYEKYRRNIEIGLKYGERLENPVVPSPVPRLERDNARNVLISTKWKKYRGVSKPKVRGFPSVDPRIARQLTPSSTSEESFTKILEVCDEYPKTVDFVKDKHFDSPMKRLTRKKITPEVPLTRPLDCIPPREFIMNRSKKEFKKRTKEMADEVFKIYKHRMGEKSSESGGGTEGVQETEDYGVDETDATETEG